jgi:carboxyl-terminal processing protease
MPPLNDQAQSGVSTGNVAVPMSDGAKLAITTAIFVDRTGVKYGDKMQPDEVVEGTSKTVADDPVVKAAANWLGKAGDCPK